MSHHTPHQAVAATAHLVEAERILAALPLAKRGERENRARVAFTHAVLSVAASLLGSGDWQATTEDDGTN